MVELFGKKYACEPCIKGHRTTGCQHADRPLQEVRRKGRPTTQCGHCRELRKVKQVHIHCQCMTKEEGEAAHGTACCCREDTECACWSPRKTSAKTKKTKVAKGDGGKAARSDDLTSTDRHPRRGSAPQSSPSPLPTPSLSEHSQFEQAKLPIASTSTRTHGHAYSPYSQAYEHSRSATFSSAEGAPSNFPYPPPDQQQRHPTPPPPTTDSLFADLLALAPPTDPLSTSVPSALLFPTTNPQPQTSDQLPALRLECDANRCGDLCSCPHEPSPTEPTPMCKKPAECTMSCLSCFIMTVPPDDCIATMESLEDATDIVNNGIAEGPAPWSLSGLWGPPEGASNDAVALDGRMAQLFEDISAADGSRRAAGEAETVIPLTALSVGDFPLDLFDSATGQWN